MKIPVKDGETRFLIAVYGSPRKNCYNNGMLANAKVLAKERVKGYTLYSLGPYPAAVPGYGSIIVEVYSVPLPIFEKIHGMEVSAGYELDYVLTSVGRAVMYIMPSVLPPEVPGGDWSAYHEAV